MRILQVSTSDRRGGAEGVARALRAAYESAGHGSWLAAGHPSGADPATLELSAERRRLLSAADRALGLEEFRFPATRGLLELPPERPDILHCHNLHGWYFDLRRLPQLSRRLPVFLTLHDQWLFTGHCAHSPCDDRWLDGCGSCCDLTVYPAVARDATAVNWRRKRRIYAKSDLRVATPSAWLGDRVDRSPLAAGVVERRVIPNGVDLERFAPGDREAARARLGVDGPVLAVVGTDIVASPWKDWTTLHEAVLRLQTPVTVLVAGTEHPDEAPFRFLRAGTDVVDLYRAADVYVHAARFDTFPTTVLEALACGTPVVATAVGGIPEQVSDGVGALVPPHDAEALAHAVDALLGDDDHRRAAAGAARRAAVARFDERTMADAYLAWFAEALAC